MTRKYYFLIKPERTFTNVLTATAGYLFASKWQIVWSEFGALVAGITFVIASACVSNNIVDRRLDQKMARTKHRALASGEIPAINAAAFATVLGAVGFWLLLYVNWLTVAVVAVAFLTYVVIYGLAKRTTVHSTLIGTVPGSASLVAGYTAFTNRLDMASLILFLIMLSWQMVHFYAIAIYRQKDYAAAHIPVISVVKGAAVAKRYMFIYLGLFMISTVLLTFAGPAGYTYLAIVLVLGIYWLWRGVSAIKADNEAWARGMFKTSLSVLLILAVAISMASVLP